MIKILLFALVFTLTSLSVSAQTLQSLHKQCQALAAHSTVISDFSEKLGGTDERLLRNHIPINAVSTAGDSVLMVTRECYLLLRLFEIASLITDAEKTKQAASIIGKQIEYAADNASARRR